MANWLDGNPAQNNESQPCGGFHSQAVHSWPDKGILYTAPTQTHWAPSTVALSGPSACAHRLEKDQRQNKEAPQELASQKHWIQHADITDTSHFSCDEETNNVEQQHEPVTKSHVVSVLLFCRVAFPTNLNAVLRQWPIFSCFFSTKADYYTASIRAHYLYCYVQ